MKTLRLALGFAVVGQIAIAWMIWPDLPEQIPTHFDASGYPDGWGGCSGLEWFLIPTLMAVAGLVSGFGLPVLAVRMARKNSQWLNVPNRERFAELPEESRVAAVRVVAVWLAVIGIELQVLTAFLVDGTYRVAIKQWEGLPPIGIYGLVGLLLCTAIALAVASSRAVKREIAEAGPATGR